VVASLGASIILFTFLLKASTAFISIPQDFWTYVSGGILVFFGITLLFPKVWESLPGLSKLTVRSNKLLGSGHQKKSVWGDIVIGAALGPVFSTCSPTYFVILASVLPASFALGTLYLLAYVLGLSLILLLIALLGERFASKLTSLSDPNGWLKRSLGVLFVVVGIMIISGLDKQLQTSILENGYFDVTKVEQKLLEKI
jgi:cytochrome c biogenesis protein CcdA